MTEPRVSWGPINATPLSEIETCVSPLVINKGGVTILRNGTLLFIQKDADNVESARRAMLEARFLTDFRVKRLQDGNYLVALHGAVGVFVGAEEFLDRKEEIKSRSDDLKFPSEKLLVPNGWTEDEFLVGLYGRGKLQRDVHDFNFYARID